MRGKASIGLTIGDPIRITPAHAGKSVDWAYNRRPDPDHPRACGEKFFDFASPCSYSGSPPRMRGKVIVKDNLLPKLGITPAHAGKSFVPVAQIRLKEDHPRACGEKGRTSSWVCGKMGSPPRMRGKAVGILRRAVAHGITPAHAGKSTVNAWIHCVCKDHPRACGEKIVRR